MRFSFTTAALAALQATSIVAHPHDIVQRDVVKRDFERCGTSNVPANHLDAERELFAPRAQNSSSFRILATTPTTITVDLYMHVVTTAAKKKTYTRAMLNDQYNVLNQKYSQYGISFVLKGLDFTVNDQWATTNAEQDDAELEMKKKLRKGKYDALNMYFISDINDGKLLGICTFPSYPNAPAVGTDPYYYDGCMMNADTMPKGSKAAYNQGLTAVHEAGHWFYLYHPWNGDNCNGSGDFVADTPPQLTLSSGCDVGKDTCPNQFGVDNIHNFMDYSDDACLTLFTNGQVSRMFTAFTALRQGK